MVTGWRRAFCTSIPKDTDPKATTTATTPPSPTARSPRLTSRFNFFSSPSPCSTPPSTAPRHQTSGASPGLFDFSCRTVDVVASPTPPPSSSSTQPPPYTDHKDFRSGCDSPSTTTLRCRIVKTPLSNFFSRSSNPSSPAAAARSSPSSPASASRSSPSSAFSFIKNNLRLTSSKSKNNGSKCGICSHSIKQGHGGTAIYTAVCSHAFHYPCLSHHASVYQRHDLICPVCTSPWPIESYPTLFINGIDKQYSSSTSKHSEKENIGSYNNRFKSYNDDEPLTSSTPGGRFNPIPEADEDGEDESESCKSPEFQGFFNSTPTQQIRFIGNSQVTSDVKEVEFNVSPETAVVAVSRNHETYAAVLKIKAPPTPASSTQRAPIDLVVAIDVGGVTASAAGSGESRRLETVTRAMKFVISSLSSSDRLSVVAFSGSTKRLLPLRRMTSPGRRSVRRIMDAIVVPGAVGGLRVASSSCVNDALRKAAKVLEDRREQNPVTSMLLISDSSSLPEDRRRCSFLSSTRYSHSGIPLHFLCLGGERGGGQLSSEPSDEALAKCIRRLLNVVVLDLRLQLGFAEGSTPGEISAVYSFTGRPSMLTPGVLKFGDLYAEEEREILLELRVPSSTVRSNQILTVRSYYRDPVTSEPVHGKDQTVSLPRPHSIRSSNPKIQQLRSLFLVTRAAAESRRLCERGDLAGAYHLLNSAKGLLASEPSGSLTAGDEFRRMVEAEMADVEQRRKVQVQAVAQREQERRRIAVSPRAGVAGVVCVEEKGEVLTPTSAWKAAERLAKVAVMRKSMNRVSDLHGFENARF